MLSYRSCTWFENDKESVNKRVAADTAGTSNATDTIACEKRAICCPTTRWKRCPFQLSYAVGILWFANASLMTKLSTASIYCHLRHCHNHAEGTHLHHDQAWRRSTRSDWWYHFSLREAWLPAHRNEVHQAILGASQEALWWLEGEAFLRWLVRVLVIWPSRGNGVLLL